MIHFPVERAYRQLLPLTFLRNMDVIIEHSALIHDFAPMYCMPPNESHHEAVYTKFHIHRGGGGETCLYHSAFATPANITIRTFAHCSFIEIVWKVSLL